MHSKTYPSDLKFMMEFQLIIVEMQAKVIDMRQNKMKEDIVKKASERVEKLIDIWERFDKLYFDANFNSQKNLQLQIQLSELRNKVVDQQKEIENLKMQLAWE